MVRLVLVLAALWGCGCGPSFPTPFTAGDMVKEGSAAALVHYLRQPGATAAVCAQDSSGPHFAAAGPEDFESLTAGLLDGDVPPKLWQRCAMLMLESGAPRGTASLLDAMAHAYRELLSDRGIEEDVAEQAKLEALHQAILSRPPGAMPNPEAVRADTEALRDALEAGRLGTFATNRGEELLVSIDLESGRWRGGKLTEADLDELHDNQDETMLRRIASRVRDPRLVEGARRRIIRLHVAASTFEAVRGDAEAIEARVLETGRNAIDVTDTPPSSAWLDDDEARVGGVLVRQNLEKQTVTLLAYEGDNPTGSVIPSVNLRGALFARVEDLPHPVTLCAPPDALDVTPCLRPADLKPTVPIVYVDDQGLLHFVERITAGDAQKLVYNTDNLPLSFAVDGQEVLTIEWPIVFERPTDLVFTGPAEGRGPDLTVEIERRYATRLLFAVRRGDRRLRGVVEEKDFESFVIASRGGAGRPGRRGTDGHRGNNGMAGMSATCPGSRGGNGTNGGRGGNGTNGGPGGPGGDGGDIDVRLACATGDCARVAAAVKRMVRSSAGPGGPGGAGGSGGPGGSGGQGGSGTSCRDLKGNTTFLSGGTAGMQGSNGSNGITGPRGPDGSPGEVTVRPAG